MNQPVTDSLSPVAPGTNAPLRNRIVGHGVEAPDQLLANARNFRVHPKAQQEAIETILDQVGWVDDVIVNRSTGFVVDGHARVGIALKRGEKEIPVKYVELTEAEEALILATFDATSAMAGVDKALLTELLADIPKEDEAVRSLLEQVADQEKVSLAAVSENDPTNDDVPPPPTDPKTKLGDAWVLGPHRLVCGDTSKPEDIEKLMQGKRAKAVITDPPYAIYGSSTGIASDITDDKMVRPFFRDVLRACSLVLEKFGHAYICCDWRSWPSWWEVAKGSGIVPKNCIVWNKSGSGLGSNYANTHEFIGFFSHLPMREQMTQDLTGIRPVFDTNVWTFNRVTGDEREHNAQKPVELFRRAIENSSEPGEVVVDFFGGSGTLIIAAHAAGREARVMEIDPMWCDVILARFERVTGIAPVLEGSERAAS